MKTTLLLLTALLTAPPALHAQPRHEGGGGRERPAPAEADRPGRDRRDSVIQRWLNHLEKQDPEAHRRLTALREEDPAAFREEMRARFARARQENAPRGDGRSTPPELARKRQALREARTETQRTEAREALRAALAEHIDRRLEMREQRIQSIREELDRLETRHRADKARRDTWIEETLESLSGE